MIKPPKFHPNALPTSEGWVSRKTKELLKKEEHTDEQIDLYKKAHSGEYKLINREYVSLKELKAAADNEVVEEETIEEVEVITSSKPINKMNKTELKEYALENDIETENLSKKQILQVLKEADLT